MNDELEIIEEFQSDSINELVSERKKNKAVQIFMMQPSTFTKYYYIENYPNSDSLFYATIPLVLHYEGGYVNDKFGRGGETNMGITQPFLDTYKKKSRCRC